MKLHRSGPRTSKSNPWFGYRVGPYVIERALGRQGVATLFVVRRDGTGPLKILRQMNRGLIGNSALRARFERETELARQLDSPYLARVEDAGEADMIPYALLDYFEGGKLRDHVLESAPLVQRDAAGIAHQIARALATTAASNIVLRTLDPRTVIVTPDDTVRILEFGQALVDGETPTPGLGLLTVHSHYQAPEQLLDGEIDIRTDLFALGVTLYEMLTASSPFGDDGLPSRMAERIRHGPRAVGDLRPEVAPDVSALASELLAYDPADRPSSPAEVAERIEAWTEASKYPNHALPSPAYAAVDRAARPSPDASARAGERPRPALPDRSRHRWGAVGRRRLILPVAAALAALAAVVVVGFVASVWDGDGEATGATAAADLSTPPRPDTDDSGAVAVPPSKLSINFAVSTEGEGTIRRFPPGPVEAGTRIELTAQAAEGWRFLGWQGDLAGDVATIVVDVKTDLTARAVFAHASWRLRITTVGEGTVEASPGSGSAPLAVGPDRSTIIDDGTSLDLVAQAAPGWQFAGWSGSRGFTADSFSLVMDADIELTATFEAVRRVVVVGVLGNGQVTLEPEGPEFDVGTAVQLTAVPDLGWRFVQWQSGASGSDPAIAVTVREDRSFLAIFEPLPPPAAPTYTVGGTVEGGGSVSITPSGNLSTGTTVAVTASAAEGWKFDHWEGDLRGTANPGSLTISAADARVIAVFVDDPQVIVIE